MDDNRIRAALAYSNTFYKLAHRYLAPPLDSEPRQNLEDSLIHSCLQLRAALTRILGDSDE